MELRHIKYFVAVAEELSFTRAAVRLHISQPPLSQQIRQLEDILGVELFDRAARPLRLTAAGVLLLKRSRIILAEVHGSMDEVRQVGQGQKGRLVISFVGSAMYSFLPDALTRFGRSSPDVELVLHEMLAADIAEALRERRIDIGFLRPPLEQSDDFDQRLLLEEPFVLAVPEQHPFANRELIDLRELESERLILYPRYPLPSTTEFVLRTCAAAGFAAHVVQEVRHIQTAITLVSAGVGLTWVPRSVGLQSRRGVRFVPFQLPAPVAALYVAVHKNSGSLLLANFLSALDLERDEFLASMQ